MRKYDIPALIRLLAVPALTAVLGLVLLVSPDSVSALAGKVLALLLILAGLAFGFLAVRGEAANRTGRILRAVVCLALGFWLLTDPLLLTQSVARFAGVLLILRGAQNLGQCLQFGQGMPPLNRKLVISAVTALVGLVLVVLPMASSRLVLSICGIVLIGIGCAEGYDRLMGRRYLSDGEDRGSDIIDAL